MLRTRAAPTLAVGFAAHPSGPEVNASASLILVNARFEAIALAGERHK